MLHQNIYRWPFYFSFKRKRKKLKFWRNPQDHVKIPWFAIIVTLHARGGQCLLSAFLYLLQLVSNVVCLLVSLEQASCVSKWYFAYICPSWIWMQWSEKQGHWLVRPSADTLMTSVEEAWPLLWLFLFLSSSGTNIYTLALYLDQRHVEKPNRMMAFEVLRAKVSHTLENLFYRNYKQRSCLGQDFIARVGKQIWAKGSPQRKISLVSAAKDGNETFY